MTSLLARPAWQSGDRTWVWRDVIDELRRSGEWTALADAARIGAARWRAAEADGSLPSEAAVERALEEFRHEHGLISADDVEGWLERWDITFEEWIEWVARSLVEVDEPSDRGESPDDRGTLVEAICSGALLRAVARLSGEPPFAGEPSQATSPRHWTSAARAAPPFAFPFVATVSGVDCGPAALTSVCRFHGIDIGLDRVRALAGDMAAGTSLNALVDAARRLGFEASAVKGSRRRLDQLALPAIVHVDRDHWIALYRVGADEVEVADPSHGLLVVPRGEFESRWSGWAALLTR